MLEKCAELIRTSKNTVVLTGAGMSTESGVPDFRSDRGIYKKVPETVLSYKYFFSNPDKFYDFIKEYFLTINVEPNIGHKILADWQTKGYISSIITQNIDGLHQMAGNTCVLEVHGTMKTATCVNKACGAEYNLNDVLNNNHIICSKCNSLVKPNVVLYDESVTEINSATTLVRKAELLIILGSSMTVYPVASLPLFLDKEKHTIIINNTPTQYDSRVNTIAIHKPIGETLQKIDCLLW